MPRAMRSDTFHGLLSAALALALTLGLILLLRLDARHWYNLLLCWLLAVNVITFCYYGYDKRRARSSRSRVPEVVLHGLALAGGTLGAYAGMRLFRHKTIKGSFRIVFFTIAVLQAGLVAAALWRLWKDRG
jgi:uncharacterized membrane protein YsdA (DUF1294 family)